MALRIVPAFYFQLVKKTSYFAAVSKADRSPLKIHFSHMLSEYIIGVMGPGEGATETEIRLAYRLGQLIAAQGWVLLTGGRNCGVMDAASRGAQEAGGLTIGILPTASAESVSSFVSIPVFTDLGNARNSINVLSSRVVVACGMGAGTASETALAIKSGKPVLLLGQDELTVQFFSRLGKDLVQIADSPEAVIQLITGLTGQSAR
jgi:uncharacterized protein (TIGR00725 family)